MYSVAVSLKFPLSWNGTLPFLVFWDIDVYEENRPLFLRMSFILSLCYAFL